MLARMTNFCIIAVIFASFTIINGEEACSCGVKQAQRIIGGQAASAKEYPWMIGLSTENSGLFCGASLINENWVLSAAHCFPSYTKIEELEIIIGDHEIYSINSTSVYRVKRLILHPQYNEDTVDNDIALLELKTPAKYGEGIGPVCLPAGTSSEKFVGKTLHTIGWGVTKEGGQTTYLLQELPIPIMSRAECITKIGEDRITKNMFCAYTKGRDTCQGDSGGPATVEVSGKHIQLGIVSWGFGCARENSPGVYVEVPNYVDWIKKETGAKFCPVNIPSEPLIPDTRGDDEVVAMITKDRMTRKELSEQFSESFA